LTCRTWPAGIRLIVRRRRPHPGVQLRFTDRDGLRLTAFRHQHPTVGNYPIPNCAIAAAPAAKTASGTPLGTQTPAG